MPLDYHRPEWPASGGLRWISDLTPEQETFRDSVRRFAEKHLAPGALARAHAADYPWDVARLMAKQGLLGITDQRSRRRAGRRADGRGDRDRDGRLGLPAQRRRRPGRQLRRDPRAGRIRLRAPERALSQEPAGRRRRHLRRHDRARGGFGSDRSRPRPRPRTATVSHQWQQDFRYAFAVRRRDPHLCALRARRRRDRLGARRHEIERRPKREALDVHVGRGVGADLLRGCATCRRRWSC